MPQAKNTQPEFMPIGRTSISSTHSNSATANPARTSISSRAVLEGQPRRSNSTSNSVNTATIDNDSDNFIPKINTEKRPSLKRYQTQKTTSNTDATNISKLEAQLYNLPAVNATSGAVSRSASVTSGSRNRALSQGIKSNKTDIPLLGLAVTTSNGTPIEQSTIKKPPFLRRASSAILRKASLRGDDSSSSLPPTPISPTTPLPTPVSAGDKKPYIRSALGRQLSSTSLITNLNKEGYTANRNISTPLMRTSSFSHRMKRGITRIMSSNGSSSKLSSKVSLENISSVGNPDPQRLSNPQVDNPMFEIGNRRQNSNGQTSNNSVIYMGSDLRINDSQSKSVNRDNDNSDYFSYLKPGEEDSEYKTIAVNMDVWKSNVPVINVTDHNSLDSNMRIKKVDTQCSKIFCLGSASSPKTYGDNKATTSTGNKSKNQSSGDSLLSDENIQTMEIKDYVKFLHKQSLVEDSTFEKLERQFLESGWCSKSDLDSIRQKRQTVNKRWDEIINFYQSKLL